MANTERKRPHITITRDRSKCSLSYNLMDLNPISLEKNPNIPIPYASVSGITQMPCSLINPNKVFRRAGLIPFTSTKNGPIIFLTLYKGWDRGNPVIELSDFGGKVEKEENFVRALCFETLEESLGLFDFLGNEDIIRNNAFASFTDDCSVITMVTPISLKCEPLEVTVIQAALKLDINGPLEEPHVYPHKKYFDRSLLEKSPKLAKLIGKTKGERKLLSSDMESRTSTFNANETTNIVYLTLAEAKTLLRQETCPMSTELYIATGSRYTNFPPLYFVVAKHLLYLIAYIEEYYKLT